MKHQLKEGMAARCANAQELRSAINAIVAAGTCPVHWRSDIIVAYDQSSTAVVWNGELVRHALDVSACRTWIPIHEFILRALGQWIEEPKELTLEVARELLKESIRHVLNNDIVGQRKWAAKLAEYGIKP